MNPRNGETYLTYTTVRGLRYAAIRESKSSQDKLTADALADAVLQAWLKKTHPDIWQHLEETERAEKSFREGLEK
jgi:hypothetical protein